MSSAVVSAPYTAGASSSETRRRSLFKPSTWTSKKHREEIHDGVAPAGLDGPEGTNRNFDPVEGGAPLSALVQNDYQHGSHSHSHEHSHELSGQTRKQSPKVGFSSLPPNPSTTLPSGSNAKSGSSLPIIPDTQGRIIFYRKDQPNYHLSNSSTSHPIYYNNLRYPSAEHLFQALKFLPSHPEIAAKIRRARSPLDAMRVARQNTQHITAGWISDGVNVRVMHQVVLAKFSQHSVLGESLLETEDSELVDGSPNDVFWGTGEGRGRNMLGKVLADVRELLRVNCGVGYGSAAKTM